MKIKANQIIDVSITDDQQKKIIVDFIENKLNWNFNFYVLNKRVYKSIVYSGSHSWSEEVFIRDASNQDVTTFEFCKLINNLKLEKVAP